MLSGKNWRAVMAVGLVVVVLLAAAAAVAEGRAATGSTPTEKVPATGQSDERRQLKEGEVLEIALEGNPSTGYTWGVAEVDERVLQLLGEEFVASPNEGENLTLGAEETNVLRFLAAGKGSTILKLVYARPWEKDVQPLRTHIVEVIVQ